MDEILEEFHEDNDPPYFYGFYFMEEKPELID